jgi:predicted nucleic acid-binding protein
MNVTFVDTAFLIAALRKPDEPHKRALAWQPILTGSRTGREK